MLCSNVFSKLQILELQINEAIKEPVLYLNACFSSLYSNLIFMLNNEAGLVRYLKLIYHNKNQMDVLLNIGINDFLNFMNKLSRNQCHSSFNFFYYVVFQTFFVYF